MYVNELQVNLNNGIWNLTKGKILNEYDMQHIISINTIKFNNMKKCHEYKCICYKILIRVINKINFI